MLAWSINAALTSGVFDAVFVSTDSRDYAAIAESYGARVIDRPAKYAADQSPDILWVEHALTRFGSYDAMSILRPTSPFRTADTIRRAWRDFSAGHYDSLRAVEPVTQHPGKMWQVSQGGSLMTPIWPRVWQGPGLSQPYHSMPTQQLPPVLVQNASLEIAWIPMVRRTRTIAGMNVHPFLTEGFEGFDINNEVDWVVAEWLLAQGRVELPEIGVPVCQS